MLRFCHGGNILASHDDGEDDEYNAFDDDVDDQEDNDVGDDDGDVDDQEDNIVGNDDDDVTRLLPKRSRQ